MTKEKKPKKQWSDYTKGQKAIVIISAIVIFFVIVAFLGEANSKRKEANKPKPYSTLYSDPKALMENTEFSSKIRGNVAVFIEKLDYVDSQVLASRTTLSIYSKEPIKDKAGTEYKYSIAVSGNYKNPKTNELTPYMMTLGFKDAKAFDEVKPVCLQYVNIKSGEMYNNVAPEYDVLEKLKGITQEE